ncbi:chemotaxis protein CheB [Deinococcus koreensis]|uniref:protein-glutamate methylesterase n=1 Tax=Deinococcus koreensis TaxID=2054903 RepID=A0A2K3US90_9DEIO|nr:chemotaxis protein CheB [Deinococcus koreensis]PNY79377.1 hypothetical protein CVO96_19845 [Deinococcus koreensis]
MHRAAPSQAFDVLALTGTTAQLDVLQAVLDELPQALSVALIVTASPLLVGALGSRLRWPLRPVEAGEAPVSGHVYLCPPDTVVDVGRDGCWARRPARGEASPSDRLLASLAAHYGARALAVVLSSAGDDGAAGAQAIIGAGGTVLAQRPDGPTGQLGRAAAALIGGRLEGMQDTSRALFDAIDEG